MPKPSPEAHLCATTVRKTASRLHRKLRPSLQRDGISMGKLSVIAQVSRAPGITPTELAAHEGVKIQTLTRLLAELETDGWLRREAHPSDGRQSVLSLTVKGKKRLLDAVGANEMAFAHVIAAHVSAEDRAVLLRACAILDDLVELIPGRQV
jgi:DNA-binding MarR family transcriptional regulator